MTFFNKKEDVLEIKLTPYGRKLLSHGKLKPEFYAFYDDDILYDSGKAGFSESNTQTKTRILSETPSLRAQSSNFGVETTLATDFINHPGRVVLDNYMPKPIGTNSQIEKKNSGWNIIALDKEYSNISLTSSLNNATIGPTNLIPQGQPTLQIPQIDLSLEFTMSVGNVNYFFGEYSDLANEFDLREDGDKFIKLEKEQGVLYFLEKNGFVNRDSFEVEVFIEEEDGKSYKKLEFAKQEMSIENGLLKMSSETNTIIDNNNVEFYLDLLLDKEVPDEDICKGIDRLRESNIYIGDELKCPDREEDLLNIYASTLGDIEECD